jgi:hypothetical protein
MCERVQRPLTIDTVRTVRKSKFFGEEDNYN